MGQSKHEPISRLRGAREFWSLDLAIGPAALDPRADTETLVAAALAAFAGRRREAVRVLDLGTGSGAILCALLTELPGASGVAVDLSPQAAAVARANLTACGLGDRARVIVGSWGDALGGQYDLIVSNPPYIASAEIGGLELEVRDHDPHLALDGGADGLDAYRALAPALARLLAPRSGRFFVEIGAGQAARVTAILAAAGLEELKTLSDLSDHERVIAGARAFPS